LPEAALFARSHNPAAIPPIVKAWRSELEDAGKSKLAQTIGDPEEDKELFVELAGGPVTQDSEGSGVMVEKEDGEPVEKDETVVEKAVEAVKEPVEGLVEKVKDLTVGNGNGNGGE
jgi:coatomer subunit beta'